METIPLPQNKSNVSRAHCTCVSFRSLCMKQPTRTLMQLVIAVFILVGVGVAIIGWQIHVNVAKKNDSQMQSSSPNSNSTSSSPTVTSISFPIKSVEYSAQFMDNTNETLYKYLPRFTKRLL